MINQQGYTVPAVSMGQESWPPSDQCQHCRLVAYQYECMMSPRQIHVVIAIIIDVGGIVVDVGVVHNDAVDIGTIQIPQ